jgi:hypothetical protein
MRGRAMTTHPRRPAALALVAGLLVIIGARLVAPGAPPLYDGVVPLEPYLWVNPPPGGAGGPKGTTADVPNVGGQNDLIAVATNELQPQAQVFATPGALVMPAGSTAVKVSIEPLAPTVEPADGHVSGNVYRILVTDDQGRPLTAPESAKVSVVLRAGDPNLTSASIGILQDGSWKILAASVAGFGATFIAVVTGFGDFAVIAPGPDPNASGSAGSPSGSPGATPIPSAATTSPGGILDDPRLPIAGVAVIIVVMLGVAFLGDRRRRPPSQKRDGWRR